MAQAIDRYVEARIKVAGLHNWPESPDSVQFLRSPHRHLFGIRVRVSVNHSGRDVEFFTLQDSIQEVMGTFYTVSYNQQLKDFGEQSCEGIAETVGQLLQGYGYHVIQVSVDEDEESFGVYVNEIQ